MTESNQDRFLLSLNGKSRWCECFEGILHRGMQKKIAIKLSPSQTAKRTSGSWQSLISLFFKGEYKGLKLVFEKRERLEIVATELGLSTHVLEEWLDTARWGGKAASPYEVHIPGFEDYGPVPILDAFFPMIQGGGSWSGIPKVPDMYEEHTNRTHYEAIVALVLQNPKTRPLKLVVQNIQGVRNVYLVKAVAASLQRHSFHVSFWSRQRPFPEGGVLVVEDFQTLNVGERQDILDWTEKQEAILLAETKEQDSLPELASACATYKFHPGDWSWSLDYLEHLKKIVQSRRSAPLILKPLEDWLRGLSSHAKVWGHFDLLGWLARYLMNKGVVPSTYSQLLSHFVSQFAEVLKVQNLRAEGEIFNLAGKDMLGKVAVQLCRSNKEAMPRQVWCQTLVDSLPQRTTSPLPELSWVGIGGVLDACVRHGFLEETSCSAEPNEVLLKWSQSSMLSMALGSELGKCQTLEPELLEHILLHSELHPALVVAAQAQGDLSPIMRQILGAPVALLSQSIHALTRLLASDIDVSEPEVYQSAFLLCLSVWVRWPLRKRYYSMSEPTKAEEEYNALHKRLRPQQFLDDTPIVLWMARASMLHQHHLLESISVEEIKDGRWLRGLGPYLRILGIQEPLPLQVEVDLAVMAPFQTHALWSSDIWMRMPTFHNLLGDGSSDANEEGYLFFDAWSEWLRLYVSKRMEQAPDQRGFARIAGMENGYQIRWWVSWLDEHNDIWLQALHQCFQKREAGVEYAFAEAVVAFLEFGYRRDKHPFERLWNMPISPTMRKRLQQSTCDALRAMTLSSNLDAAPATQWILEHVLTDNQREAVWDIWSKEKTENIPWIAFWRAGLSPQRLASWAFSLPIKNIDSSLGRIQNSILNSLTHSTRYQDWAGLLLASENVGYTSTSLPVHYLLQDLVSLKFTSKIYEA